MSALAGYQLLKLREDRDLAWYRGETTSAESPILVLAPVAEVPASMTLLRMEHELSLADSIQPDWGLRPLSLARHNGRTIQIFADPGGDFLDRETARQSGLRWKLQTACSLTAAIGRMHAHGFIHRDIKPENVIVDARGTARLTGFGVASRLPRERQALTLPSALTGTLAYMAPEQTGRMNRSVDTRSDLYSLGVTLYELFAGVLPFSASDPLEWIHCHLARHPTPWASVAPGIPEVVGRIVLKLLEKTPEDRYQTAEGVRADLARCLAELDGHAEIASFQLGSRDLSHELRVPEKLYGRETEIRELVEAFDTVVKEGVPRLVLVTGYSGIGKSSLVNELHQALVPVRGLFAAGKFDQYKRNIPYATLTQACRQLIRHVLSESDTELAHWRRHLREAVGTNGQLIVNVIPELELVIGKQPDISELPSQDAKSRFQQLFARFLSVFAQPDHPLVVFLDDLQWLDAATLELLEYLLVKRAARHVLWIGAYRDNEVTASHALTRSIAAIRDGGAPIREMNLAPLTRTDVETLIAETLQTDPVRCQPLADLVHEKSGGNPFFAIQFLMALAEESLIHIDQGSGRWEWDIARIRAKGYTANVVDLMAGKLNRFPPATLDALKWMACVGASADSQTLARVRETTRDRIESDLEEVVRVGLILKREHVYTFLHDRVQEAAYALIPAPERAAMHLRMGRTLVAEGRASDLDEPVFEIVNQFNRAGTLLIDATERETISELNLEAAQRARISTAYVSALSYLEMGRALLPADRWERLYRLTFELEVGTAECEFLTGSLQAAEQRLNNLASRAVSLVDRASVASLAITLQTAVGRMDRAVEMCLAYLRQVGIHWSAHPLNAEVEQEYEPIRREIEAGEIERRLVLPLMGDRDRRATLDVLAAVLPPAFFSDQNFVCRVLCRMTNSSLEQGNSGASALAYAYLGMVLGPRFGQYAAGYRFGKVGMALTDEPGLDRFKARVVMTFGHHVIPYTRHMREGRALLLKAFDLANETGDLTYSGFSCCTLITNLLGCGAPLGEIEAQAERTLAFVRDARFGLIVDIISAQLQLVRALRGMTDSVASFRDGTFDDDTFQDRLMADPGLAIAACWYWIRRLQAHCFAGQFAAAVEASKRAEPLLWTTAGHLELVEFHFYSAVARAGMLDSAAVETPDSHLAALRAHCDQLRIWADNSPESFGQHADLIEGELLRIEDAPLDALRKYEKAAAGARAHGFVQIEALSYEAAHRLNAQLGLPMSASSSLRAARDCYVKWGAAGKVKQLERTHAELRAAALRANGPDAPVRAEEQLDIATLLKTSQAVSGEIGLERLIRTLLVLALEHAGAERGLLIMPRRNELVVEAEATVGHSSVDVVLPRRPLTARDAPESLVQYALRSQDAVVLADALEDPQFGGDPYVGNGQHRSLLALPLLKQTKLIGVLYLENKLAPHVFTPSRLAILKVLASQAATSLENASLEEKDALLKEVHHRVKNNLQLISSLLNLQASRITDPGVAELFAESRNRVRSMALVHENLYRAGSFARISMKAHVQSLCAELVRVYSARTRNVELTTHIADILFDVDRAVTCGLIINELVSNALKHAFPAGRSGQIRVELTHREESQCVLVVADDGTGMPSALRSGRGDSLGMELVHDLVGQLGGISTVSGDSGTVWTIQFAVNDPRVMVQ